MIIDGGRPQPWQDQTAFFAYMTGEMAYDGEIVKGDALLQCIQATYLGARVAINSWLSKNRPIRGGKASQRIADRVAFDSAVREASWEGHVINHLLCRRSDSAPVVQYVNFVPTGVTYKGGVFTIVGLEGGVASGLGRKCTIRWSPKGFGNLPGQYVLVAKPKSSDKA